jgi:hypothetical protein
MNDEYGWQEYVPVHRGRPADDTPFVYARGSDLFLNKTALELLGNPETLTILIDKRNRRIGFRLPLDGGQQFAIKRDRRIRAGGLFIILPGIGGRRIPLTLKDGILASGPIE